jgi:hypothetical protein
VAKIHHPRGLTAVWPSHDGPRVILYGTVSGWPLWVRCWRAAPPPDVRALRLDRDLWIALEVADCIAPPVAPQLFAGWDDG